MYGADWQLQEIRRILRKALGREPTGAEIARQLELFIAKKKERDNPKAEE